MKIITTLFILVFANNFLFSQILSESFEGELFPPDGWTETEVTYSYGTHPDWYRFDGTDLSVYNPGYGSLAQDGSFSAVFNSDGCMWKGRLETPSLDLSVYDGAELSYQMFHDPMSSWDIWETIQVQISINNGSWQNLGEANKRQIMDPDTTYWEESVLSLTDYIGYSNVRVGFLASGDDGENMHIDNVVITEAVDSFPPEITDIQGLSVSVNSDMKIRLYTRDHSNVQSTINAIYSFDNFSTNENIQFNLIEELPEGDLYRFFLHEALISSINTSNNGKLKIELVDELGNGTGLFSDEFEIDWYSPLNEITEGFEEQEDFSFNINNWNNFDLDGLETYGVSNGYPHSLEPGQFQIFNPSQTDPPLGDTYFPNTGNKGAVAFQTIGGSNNDWLISKAIIPTENLSLSIWAKEIYEVWDEYATFEIAVSTTSIYPEDFVSASETIITTSNWTNFNFDLSSFTSNEYIYIAIHCISSPSAGTGLYIDDIEINSGFVDNEAPELELIKGDRVSTNSDMKIWVYLKDRSEIATTFEGNYSFDNFSTSENISFTFREELESDLYNHYIYEGTIPIQTDSKIGKVKFELVDEYGNGLNSWSEPFNIEWYSPILPIIDGFEEYEDFSIDFTPWVNYDFDRATTWGPSTGTYTNQSSPKSFMIFNPSSSNPPMTEAWHQPHTGEKTALCSKSTDTNNDWLISPAIIPAEDLIVKFWAKTIDSSWGDYERFRVCVSTSGIFPENFEVEINNSYVQGENYIEAGGDWTQYTFDLSNYSQYDYIYVGFQCISEYITLNGLFIDDFEATGTVVINDELSIMNYELKQNYPNPFNPMTRINYTSAPLSVNQSAEIVVYNALGQTVWSTIVWAKNLSPGSSAINNHGSIQFDGSKFNSGIYYYSLVIDGKKMDTKPMVLIK